jgi:ribosomal protein L34
MAANNERIMEAKRRAKGRERLVLGVLVVVDLA